MKPLWGAVLLRLLLGLGACGARADEFSEGAAKPSADEIERYVEGNVFNIKMATGDILRADYKP